MALLSTYKLQKPTILWFNITKLQGVIMVPDLTQIAKDAAQPKKAAEPKVVVFDYNETTVFGTDKYNWLLLKFATLSIAAGHTAFIVTRQGGTDAIELTLMMARRKTKDDALLSVRFAHKWELQEILKQEPNLGDIHVVFDDKPEEVAVYAPQAKHIEEVKGFGFVTETMRERAKELGFGAEFEAYLREQQLNPAPAPAPGG